MTQHNCSLNVLPKARLVLAFLVIAIILSACLGPTQDSGQSAQPQDNLKIVYVVKIKDGDSLILRDTSNREFEARLFGIDAPELNQAYGKEAKRALSKLAYKQRFSIRTQDTDKYQRAVVILSQKNVNLNKQMVEAGHAWVYRQYNPNPNYIKLERAAKRAKKGLWKLPRAIAPWEWRKQK